jgi:U3 small nucleolar RNA-associated protein 14
MDINLNDMLGALGDSAMFSTLKKSVSKLDDKKSSKSKLNAPLPQALQDKITRKAAREQTAKELEKWDPIVERNRTVDHLRFAENRVENTIESSKTLIREFEVRLLLITFFTF